ncbi:peptide/nickel transport system ATP-binding protein [Sphaerotilus hippei]|uniref:Peptide/nickel transport system ATP-binding protein n=1 Tax=Sphaerotilus hippei TaxID=744406 RepID=A0A318H2S3_9BURK|nr:dipeptide ABC transporter ATP-binding protein [Sphaerotilus hippei]PXW95856.1 peptide/nickel transport system ATP-binding protein [Sphaerotilus hippei]
MLLSIQDLQVDFRTGRIDGETRYHEAVGRGHRGVSFNVAENSTVALVGESGSGKSVTAMSILNLLPDNARRRGHILFQGRDLLRAGPQEMRALRGREIACVFQDPMSSLNPVLTVGEQLCEPLTGHLGMGRQAARARAEELLEEVGMPEPRRRLAAYAHELSGGQQQRVMIAMALACKPKLLIADEPTTALDVTIQRQILELLQRLQARHRMGMIFISHDLGVVGEIADQVVVMRQGLVREQGSVRRLFTLPQDPYTRALLSCRPLLTRLQPARLPVVDDQMAADASKHPPPLRLAPAKDPQAPVVLEARGLAKSFSFREGLWLRREFQAVQSVGFTLQRGHTLGVVGESGSGKTTLGLMLLGLHAPTAGDVLLDGQPVVGLRGAARQALRRQIQIVFQNPYASLNPRHTIGETLLEPLRIHRIGADDAARGEIALRLLERVGLDAQALSRHPHEFSGGQRQRIAIARALTLSPRVLVLDEAVSALDVSVQAQVLNLLKDLQDELGLAYVFISHDLAVVRFMADEVLVMQQGRVVEQAATQQLLGEPREDYTRQLLASIPRGWRRNVA